MEKESDAAAGSKRRRVEEDDDESSSVENIHRPRQNLTIRGMFAHARAYVQANGGGSHEQCFNILFRGGPCNICGRKCFANLSDKQLSDRLLTGKKPVGTFTKRSKWIANALARSLRSRGLATWQGKNRWNMYVVVASLHPDTAIPKAMGTPREVAFTRAFIDEELPLSVCGALYGYPPCGLY